MTQPPPSPTRFVTDSSLAFVAKRLRFLGYDVALLPGARLDELFAAARRERRTVLTLSDRHPRRFADLPVLKVRRGSPDDQVKAIAASHAPSGPPFGRCGECNDILRRRHPMEAMGEVPGRVLRQAPALTFCPGCGKWYWEGSHVTRLRAWLERALGRRLESPGTSDPGSG